MVLSPPSLIPWDASPKNGVKMSPPLQCSGFHLHRDNAAYTCSMKRDRASVLPAEKHSSNSSVNKDGDIGEGGGRGHLF